MTDDQYEICAYVHKASPVLGGLHGLKLLTLSKLDAVLNLATANKESLTREQLMSIVNLGNKLTGGMVEIESEEFLKVTIRSLDHIYEEIERRIMNQ